MTQAVAYISGRSEVLCASFFLAAILWGRRWLLTGGAAPWLMTWAFWIAALLTKETAIMLPFVLLCLDRLVLAGTPDEQRTRVWRLHLPLLAVAIAGALGRAAVFVMLEQPPGEGIRWLAALDAANVLWRYALLLILPIGQSIFHAIVPVNSVFEPRALASLAGLVVVLALAWVARRHTPIVSLGVTWFLLLLLPSSALMVMDSSGDMSEHRLYLASAGPLLMAGAFFGWLAASSDAQGTPVRWVAMLLLPAALLPLSGRTLLRNAIWSSPVMLWSEAAAYAPDHWMPRTVLGEALHDAGRHEEAIAAHRQALAANPDEESIYLKLGYCLAELNRFDEANATFETLRARHPESKTALNGLGIVAMMSGKPDEARSRFHEAMALDASDVTARQWLAVLEEGSGNPAEALKLCEEIQRLAPVSLGNEECVRRNREKLGR
jgi:Flp pilus assembly protein TadD